MWPVRVFDSPVVGFQIMIVPSCDPEASFVPSGDHARVLIWPVWPVRVFDIFVVGSQILTVPSSDLEAIYLPSGDHAIESI